MILLLRTLQLAHPTVTCGSLFRSNELEERVAIVELGPRTFPQIHCSEHCPE